MHSSSDSKSVTSGTNSRYIYGQLIDGQPTAFELSCLHFQSWICQECGVLYCDNEECEYYSHSTWKLVRGETFTGNVCTKCLTTTKDEITEQLRIAYEMKNHLQMIGSPCKTGECD